WSSPIPEAGGGRPPVAASPPDTWPARPPWSGPATRIYQRRRSPAGCSPPPPRRPKGWEVPDTATGSSIHTRRWCSSSPPAHPCRCRPTPPRRSIRRRALRSRSGSVDIRWRSGWPGWAWRWRCCWRRWWGSVPGDTVDGGGRGWRRSRWIGRTPRTPNHRCRCSRNGGSPTALADASTGKADPGGGLRRAGFLVVAVRVPRQAGVRSEVARVPHVRGDHVRVGVLDRDAELLLLGGELVARDVPPLVRFTQRLLDPLASKLSALAHLVQVGEHLLPSLPDRTGVADHLVTSGVDPRGVPQGPHSCSSSSSEVNGGTGATAG